MNNEVLGELRPPLTPAIAYSLALPETARTEPVGRILREASFPSCVEIKDSGVLGELRPPSTPAMTSPIVLTKLVRPEEVIGEILSPPTPVWNIVDVLSWYLLIKSLDQTNKEHVLIFDALMKTCHNSRKAGMLVAKEEKQKYLNSVVFVWRQAMDGWGGYYRHQWRMTDHRPAQEEIDPMKNTNGFLHKNMIKNILNQY
jgi:hypothetical protein